MVETFEFDVLFLMLLNVLYVRISLGNLTLLYRQKFRIILSNYAFFTVPLFSQEIGLIPGFASKVDYVFSLNWRRIS